jgi:integrase
MAMPRLTQEIAETAVLADDKGEDFAWDDKLAGYGVRLRRNPRTQVIARSFVYQYRFAGNTRRITIGAVGPMKEPAARKIAERHYAKVRLGTDPQAERQDVLERASETFGKAARIYLTQQQKDRRPRSYLEVERHLDKHLRGFHRLPLANIDQRLVAARLLELEADSGPNAANAVRANGSALFSWAQSAGLVDHNPFANVRTAKIKPLRERVLTYDELAAIWRACLASSGGYVDIVLLLILLGQRRSEIAGLAWSETVDLDMPERAAIVLPPERVKNGRQHVIPLSAAAVEIFKRQPRTWADGSARKFVFGQTRDHAFCGFSPPHRALNARIAAMRDGVPLAHWTRHDLRRTLATRMRDDLDVAPHIVEAILNHRGADRRGSAAPYNHARYERQTRAALNAWAAHLAAMVARKPADSNVIALSG